MLRLNELAANGFPAAWRILPRDPRSVRKFVNYLPLMTHSVAPFSLPRTPAPLLAVLAMLLLAPASPAQNAQNDTGLGLRVGTKAPPFSLTQFKGGKITLNELLQDQSVVLVVLRGWPGYQCPYCSAQTVQFAHSAGEFAERHATVVFVYPGPAKDLNIHAGDFLRKKPFPKSWHFITDPDYTLVNEYNLRWNAPGETAYPATFIIDRAGVIRYANVSTTHGDRPDVAFVLKALQEIK